MERLKLIDDIRKQALTFMKEDTNLSYQDASRRAKEQLVGADVKITDYHQPIKENKEDFMEIAKRELDSSIRVELYQEDQLKEMIVAKRLGVDVSTFVNIFQTPEQIHFLTILSLRGEDVAPYAMDLQFDPAVEMQKLIQKENVAMENPFQKVYTNPS